MLDGLQEPEVLTLPASWVREHHYITPGWQGVRTKGEDVGKFKNGKGIEQIARDLSVDYPS